MTTYHKAAWCLTTSICLRPLILPPKKVVLPTNKWCYSLKKQINFIYGWSKFCNSVNSIKSYQRRAKNVEIQELITGSDHEITFHEHETLDLDKPHNDTLNIRLDVRGCKLSRVIVYIGISADVLFYGAFKQKHYTKSLLKHELTRSSTSQVKWITPLGLSSWE